MDGNVFDPATIARHYATGDWDGATVADYVRHNAEQFPDEWALRACDANLTWGDYERLSAQLAGAFVRLGVPRGSILATLLPGGALVHVVYLAAARAGLVNLGMGPRSGDGEVARLLHETQCQTLVTAPEHRGRGAGALLAAVRTYGEQPRQHITVALDQHGLRVDFNGQPQPLPDPGRAHAFSDERGLTADELFFLSSTSGTTGKSKCVTATMNTRKYFAPLAAEAAELGAAEVFCSVVPAPYGFGLWSAHFAPARYRATTVLCADFDPEETLRLIESERVSVLAAVTSQFVMLLHSPEFAERDLSSLRVVFTGGERVDPDRAAEFESRTGARLLQFYGSNESGPLSVTRVGESARDRLHTVGRPITAQHVRLFDAAGTDVTATGGPGQCAARGPGVTPGYYRDAEANAELFRTNGWLLTGDVATIDDAGCLRLAGRTADLIIRGGQNISAVEVEIEVASHPRIAQAAAIGIPDPVLGERVRVVVSTIDGADIGLDALREHLDARGVSKHYWPESLVLRRQLPLGVGGKLDKQRLRAELVE